MQKCNVNINMSCSSGVCSQTIIVKNSKYQSFIGRIKVEPFLSTINRMRQVRLSFLGKFTDCYEIRLNVSQYKFQMFTLVKQEAKKENMTSSNATASAATSLTSCNRQNGSH